MYSSPTKQNEYQKAWMQERKASYLRGKSCSQCDKPAEGVARTCKDPIRLSWSWSDEKLEAALTKFTVFCKEHLDKARNKNLSITNIKEINHGTEYAYKNRRCRCKVCVTTQKKRRSEKYERTGY